MSDTFDFIIVGGGIGGAVLANLLVRQGRRVVILERETTQPTRFRPEVLWPKTVQTLQSLLPNALEDSWALPLESVTFCERSRVLLEINQKLFRECGIHPVSSNPNRTREHLITHASCEIRRGIQVESVLMERGRAVGVRGKDVTTGQEAEYLASWIVADDGSHSLVRQSSGIEISLSKFPLEATTFSLPWPDRLGNGSARVYLNRNRMHAPVLGFGAVPWPAGAGVGLLFVRSGALDSIAKFKGSLREFAAQDPILDEALQPALAQDKFHKLVIEWGHASRYGVPGVLLIGDAAHPVSPAGGQGANMSIADGVAIAELAIIQDASQLVVEYEKRRRAANAQSISITRRFTSLASFPGINWLNPLLPQALKFLNHRPSLVMRGLRFASSAFQDKANS